MKNKTKNFDIQTKLGSGSYGVIFKAINRTTKEVCVLKQISLGRLNERARKSAINEATIMGKLNHPFIVRYHESFIEENTLNIIMEYCDNGDLSLFLKMQNKKPLKQEKIWKFFIQICAGLQYIHRNKILHRDIKTLNIFLNKNEQVKIGDLGVAKMLTSNEFAQTMVGTPFYLSPQLCEEKPYNQKSDIWALGCLLYELCTYQHPFEAQNQASLILKIIRGKYNPIPEFYSKELKDMIDMCLERDYKRRPTANHILSRPKIKQLINQFKIDAILDNHSNQKKTEVKDSGNNLKTVEENIKIAPPIKNQIKPEIKKQVPPQTKALDEPIKKQVKKQEKIEAPTQKNSSKKIIPEPQKPIPQVVPQKKENKNEFMSNLQKLIVEQQKKKEQKFKKQVQPPVFFDIPWKNENQIKKTEEKVEEVKKPRNPVEYIKHSQTPSLELKKNDVLVQEKRSVPDILNIPSKIDKSSQISKPTQNKVNLSKPPMPTKAAAQSNKDAVIKVKMDKPIPAKVYQSQKNVARPQGIIKSGGFSVLETEPRQSSHSKEKPAPESSKVSQKRPSVYQSSKQQKEEPKQLFGPSPTIQHKSDRQLNKPPQIAIVDKSAIDKHEEYLQECKPVARVRKGHKNQLSRYAKNAGKTKQITKQEEDLVMNLPHSHNDSSSEDEKQKIHHHYALKDPKAKTNRKFELKDVDDSLILQKYEDILKNESNPTIQTENQIEEDPREQRQPDFFEKEMEGAIFQKNINYYTEEIRNEQESEQVQEQIYQQKRNSDKDNDQIEEMLEEEGCDAMKDEDHEEYELQAPQTFEEDEHYQKQEETKNEWEFDQEPELPQLQDQQSPYFQQNNPYLVEEQEIIEEKKNHLQIKLKENMKREDEINKLMQIKIDQCKVFVPNEKAFQEILAFFRKKINMDSEYTDQDQREVQSFLRKKGLTDQRKFQNIYKIMHFQMQLQNTRKIIQGICKKLNELQDS